MTQVMFPIEQQRVLQEAVFRLYSPELHAYVHESASEDAGDGNKWSDEEVVDGIKEAVLDWIGDELPQGDPRSILEHCVNMVDWTEHPSFSDFAAIEEEENEDD